MTYSYNNKHAYDNNLKLKGENFYISKLTEKQVKEILMKFNKTDNYQKIVDIYKVSRATIRDIILRKTWKHIHI